MTISAAEPRLRVFRGQASWVLPTLVGILLLSFTLYTWNIGYSGLSTYYAAAVKSMSGSPRALFFGSLDPSSTTTLDKLAGFLLPQVLSAKIFGFHAWSLSLPQAVEGVITVAASYVVGTRWRGTTFGIAVAGVMAFTPMLAAMFGRPMEDGMLTMCLVLAFVALQRAILTGGVGWLIASGAWIAVGFQAKMLQSWLFLPALILAYALGTRMPAIRKLRHIVVACVICVLLSVSWMTAIQLVPSQDRPYIDGTTNNNTYSMVFGYNGFDRIVPGIIPGAVPQLDRSPGSGQSTPNKTATAGAGHSDLKLVLPQFTTQIGWLYPSAIAGMALELLALLRRRGGREQPSAEVNTADDDGRLGTTIGLIVWLGVTAVVLTVAFVPHATYFATIALPLAVFAVGGFASAIDAFRSTRTRGWMILPTLVIVQTGWVAAIALWAAPQLRWIAPLALGLGLIAVLAIFFYRGPAKHSVFALRAALISAAAASLVAPVIWSLCVLGPGGGGSASDAFAGPRLAQPTAATTRSDLVVEHSATVRPPFSAPPDATLSARDARLLAYVSARNPSGSIAFATDSMPVAVSVILATNANPIPIGGFSKQAPTPELGFLRAIIADHKLRFVLLTRSKSAGLLPPNPALFADRTWVHAHCRPVMSGHFRDNSPTRQTLFDCGAN